MRWFRGRWGRRARMGLWWAPVFFLLVQIGLGLAVEHCWPEVRDQEYGIKIDHLRLRLAENPGRPLILVLGSSRVFYGLDAGQLRASLHGQPALVFNFGMSGAGSLLDLLFLQRLLAEGVKPDLLILEVLPATLNQPGPHPVEEEWLFGDRLRDGEKKFLSLYHSEPKRLLNQWVRARLLPGLRQHHELRSSLGLDTADPVTRPERLRGVMDGHGWRPIETDPTSEERQRLQAFAQAQYDSAWGDFHLAEGLTRALEQILNLCRHEGIPLALLLMPEGLSFQQFYSLTMRAGLDDYLAQLARGWDIPIVDARNWMAEEDFWDGHHLLRSGAVALSTRFEREALPFFLEQLNQLTGPESATNHRARKTAS